jgi:hypothetical protein
MGQYDDDYTFGQNAFDDEIDKKQKENTNNKEKQIYYGNAGFIMTTKL